MKVYIKMEKTIITFGDIGMEKQIFHQNIKPTSIKYIDINKVVVYNKAYFCKKRFNYFIGYREAKKIRPLCVFLPKKSVYRKDFDETKYMSFLIRDDELLKQNKKSKVKNAIDKEFDNETVCNEKYIKAKIKSYDGKVNSNFPNNKISKKDCQCICLSVILIDSVFRAGKNYHPQVFFEEYKCVVKEKKISKYIIDDI